MVELYDKRFLPDEYIENGITKLWKEGDCISIMSARFTAELAGLVKKANNRLTLTKTAARYLDTNNRLQIFNNSFRPLQANSPGIIMTATRNNRSGSWVGLIL